MRYAIVNQNNSRHTTVYRDVQLARCATRNRFVRDDMSVDETTYNLDREIVASKRRVTYSAVDSNATNKFQIWD